MADSRKGIQIREARKAKGLTQKQLAALLGCSHTTISKYEQGEIENMPRPRMKLLADILDVSPVLLFDLADIKKETATVDGLSKIKLELVDIISQLSDSEAAVLVASLKSSLGKP